MTIVRALPATILLLLAGCRQPAPTAAPTAAPAPPPGYAILPGSAMSAMLNQCSRGAPKPGQSTWPPTPGDIARMEISVGEALKGRSELDDARRATWPAGWSRAYVGIVRDGRRYIYGDFVDADLARTGLPAPRPPTGPAGVCDGGPSFFGAEWEPATGRITHLDFNGIV